MLGALDSAAGHLVILCSCCYSLVGISGGLPLIQLVIVALYSLVGIRGGLPLMRWLTLLV